jgi:uncharacterized membrane protein YfcA
MDRKNRRVAQLLVLVPTVAMSAFLGSLGVGALPRLVGSLGFGMMLIAAVAMWQRNQGS